MKCDLCPAEATIFFSQLIGGELLKVNLCKSCADEKGVTDPTGFALADMLDGMGNQTSVGVTSTLAKNEKNCACCGFSRAEFRKTGRFGCASCYQVFDDGLDELLEAMHRHTQHLGKVPKRHARSPDLEFATLGLPDAVNPRHRLIELREALSKSLEDEDYETAANLRDAISRLESQLGET